MNKFFLKIILPSILSILLFVLTIFFIIIPHFQQNIMNGKREMIKELTNSACSILSKYENDERNGLLTREEAQNIAVSRIQYLRYGEENKDYFWITDMFPIMIMHPYRPDLNGKDLTVFSDPHGKKMFVEFVETVKKSESGYVNYMWQWKDDSLHIVPKLSYVKHFKPWDWVIGTGIYIEDVKKEIKTLTQKLLWISVGISVLIAFLLFFISQQSLKIEQKRIDAENELHHSKEKYKALVEAATEGLIMLIDGKISLSNSIISKMTGFENTELINLSLNELISENNSKDLLNIFSNKSITEGQYELNFKKKNGGYFEVLVTCSTALLYSNTVNILTVKDLTIDNNSNLSDLDYQKLINALSLGFFRVRIDSKGKFLSANETTIKILGFDDFMEISEINIFDLFVNSDDRKDLINNLQLNGMVKNKVLLVRKKKGEPIMAAFTLVVTGNENPEKLICDGIIEDITFQENEKAINNAIIIGLKTNNFLIELPVKDFITPIHTFNPDLTIQEAVSYLSKRKTDCLLLVKNENDYLGIITNSDIQNRVLTLGLQLDNPAYLIMTSPVVYISENTSVSDAVYVCEEKKINHPVLKNEAGEITGLFRLNDIYKVFKESLTFFIADIQKAETNDELKQHYRKLQLFVKPLINSDISIKYITSIMSSFSDALTKRVIELSIKDMGYPPVGFSFICLGSEGRREETLLTDQDNAIIYADVPVEKENRVREYFNRLGEKVCNSLDFIGYSYCQGNIMAKNQQWCQPLSVWKKYFTNWVALPEAQNLLDASIFFDFRNIYGDKDLTDQLRKTISAYIKEYPIFLYHLALNTFNIKPQHISTGSIISDKNAETINLKEAVNLIIIFARTYALQNNISCQNTLERLNALKNNQIINLATIDEIIYVYNFLMKLRFKHQVALLDSNLPLSNLLNIKKLIDVEVSILKKLLSLLPAYQNKLGIDFRLTT